MCIQLWHNAFQRCLCDLAAACHGGGPPLTDESPNLLISPMGVEVGWRGCLSDEPNTSTRRPLTVANKIKELVRAWAVEKDERGNQR